MNKQYSEFQLNNAVRTAIARELARQLPPPPEEIKDAYVAMLVAQDKFRTMVGELASELRHGR